MDDGLFTTVQGKLCESSLVIYILDILVLIYTGGSNPLVLAAAHFRLHAAQNTTKWHNIGEGSCRNNLDCQSPRLDSPVRQ